MQKLGGFPIGSDVFLLGLTVVIDAVEIAALSGISVRGEGHAMMLYR
jgi:hypothetical protein